NRSAPSGYHRGFSQIYGTVWFQMAEIEGTNIFDGQGASSPSRQVTHRAFCLLCDFGISVSSGEGLCHGNSKLLYFRPPPRRRTATRSAATSPNDSWTPSSHRTITLRAALSDPSPTCTRGSLLAR